MKVLAILSLLLFSGCISEAVGHCVRSCDRNTSKCIDNYAEIEGKKISRRALECNKLHVECVKQCASMVSKKNADKVKVEVTDKK